MWMPWSHRGASAVSTHHESAGWECKAEGKNPILIRFAPKAHLRNFLWWGRMEMGSKCLLTRSWQPVLEESILNLSRMTERFSWLRSKIGRNPPSFPGTMKYGCRTQTLCLEQWFSIPVLGTPCSAHFACLPYLTHLIEIIRSLVKFIALSPNKLMISFRCPEARDRQEMTDLAALETPEGVVILPTPLHFWAEETERSAHWRPLRPGTLAGLALRRDDHHVMRCTPFFPRDAGPQKPWAIGIRTF